MGVIRQWWSCCKEQIRLVTTNDRQFVPELETDRVSRSPDYEYFEHGNREAKASQGLWYCIYQSRDGI